MATNIENNNALAIVMAGLAGQALSQDMEVLGLNFPDFWNIQSSFKSSGGLPNQDFAQGFLGIGRKEINNPDVSIAVLALGVNWPQYFEFYQSNTASQVSISSEIFDGAPAEARIQAFFQKAYLSIQDDIRNAIKKFLPDDITLYICGMGLGAPLAQLAALDLRPGHDWPNNDRPIAFNYQPECFVFSAPNVANKAFADSYNKTVVGRMPKRLLSYTYTDIKNSVVIDQFPTKPLNDNYQPLGTAEVPSLSKGLPTIDVPWAERSATAYISALGGKLNKGALVASTFINLPKNLKLPYVATLSKLVGETYHQAQHAGYQPDFPLPNYVSSGVVHTNGNLFAIIYKNNILREVIVAFRGAITWDETFNITSNSASVTSTLVEQGRIHGGLHKLYFQTPTDPGGSTMFRDQLWSELQPLVKEKGWKVSTTGHGIGGALAELVAMDIMINHTKETTIGSVTTFGSMPFANPSFATAYNEKLASTSFSIRRIYDKISLAFLAGPFRPNSYQIVGTPFSLNGQLVNEENTYHSISGYIQLLNGGVSSKALVVN